MKDYDGSECNSIKKVCLKDHHKFFKLVMTVLKDCFLVVVV